MRPQRNVVAEKIKDLATHTDLSSRDLVEIAPVPTLYLQRKGQKYVGGGSM
jgi:hypothetical protein